ncbi:DNA-binding protein [Lactobacillus helveticus]|uniref:DNA-binding protein n=1 Tax=Lactobacillus helveticus TaxID=1587 RepID=UPI0021C3FCD3|nr:DNA-binding protein [Lactobacillus helveticus]MCP9317725.1 DNA-binding protein [Lactobacillus helveticus]MDH5818324.1 DNA-binding protein [Lactobacillus helveticus]
MSENLRTIKELADEFNVSKQAVRKRLTEEFRANHVETVTSNGVKTLVVTYTGYMLLKQHFTTSNATGNDKATDTSNPTTGDLSVVKILEQQLFVKDKQLENKDSQISQMQNLLDQQQRLALQDKQLLEEYKAEIKDLKALKMPSQETEFKHLDNQYKDEVNALKKQMEGLQEQLKEKDQELAQEKSKKWYQFWK